MIIGTEIVDAIEGALSSEEALALCCDTIEEREALVMLVVERLGRVHTDDDDALKIELPYPPSLNHYYRHVGHRVLISREGRDYRSHVRVLLAVKDIQPVLGPIKVTVELYPPDRRLRDVDNNLKCLLDSLEKGGAFHNDAQIERLEIEKHQPRKGGKVIVRISTWNRKALG